MKKKMICRIMVQARYIKLVLLCGLFWSSALASNCPYKECDCDTFSILCQNKGLTSLPELFGTEITSLHYLILDTNQITDIPESSLPASLIELSLIENPISTVEIAAFDDSAHSLKTLSFSQARFTKIPDALLHLDVLKELTVYETNIIDWNIIIMKHIGRTLTTLSISRFGLGTWPDFIQYLPLLTELTIISSSISTIPDNAFDDIANSLTQLTLDNNSLTAVPKALSKLTSIEMLYLRNNKIVDISWLPWSNRLHSLLLDRNRISDSGHLSDVLRRYNTTTSSISIDHNNLMSIPDLSFLNLISDLDFTHNKMNDPNSGYLPPKTYNINLGYNVFPYIPSLMSRLKHVTIMLLTSNIIREIRESDIPPWTQIVSLDSNQITKIEATSFPSNSSIASLNLNYNPLSQISSSAFTNLKALADLYMQGTRLTRLPLALTSLTKLNILDVRNSSDLVCTCSESSLASLFRSMYPSDLSGNCGETTVYYFFVSLSVSCPV